jgi:glutathione peroxidase
MKLFSRLMGGLTLALCFFMTTSTTSASPIQEIPLVDIDGNPTSLKAYTGKVVLLVNVASKCGLTPQYTALEKTFRKYKDQGFVVLAMPCNDFGAQEPGTHEEIKEFCSTRYDVSFPMLGKAHVKGPNQHPLYKALTGDKAKFPGDIEWNFGKFLIGKDGEVLERYAPRTAPDDSKVIAAIESALKAK